MPDRPYLAGLANRVIDAARIYGYSVYVTTYAEGSAQGARTLLRNFNTTVSDGMILSISEVREARSQGFGRGLSAGLRGRAIRTTRRTTSPRMMFRRRVSPRNTCSTTVPRILR